MEKPFVIHGQNFLGGYVADERNRKENELAPPSLNCRITTSGSVYTRPGYEDTGINLDIAGFGATSFYMEQYDLTFFAAGTKVKYYDWSRQEVIDTGLSLTSGTTTRFAEYAGDLYLTNTTDGLRRIVVMRLNDAAPDSGDATVTVDSDGAARLSVFSITSGNLRIRGTNEAFTSLVVSTGVITLTGTLSQSYANNDIAIVVSDISSGKEKFSKITFWKERMAGIGSTDTTNADMPNANVFFSKFATAAVLENIINFTSGGGATIELVGKSGRITNILPTEDYLYCFKENEAYVFAVSDVNASSGASIPNLRSSIYGCVNEDCAADMGNGEIAFLTNNKRVMRIKISTDSGAPVVFPDESFDGPITKLLELLDEDQSDARLYYHNGKKLLHVECNIQNQRLTLIFDNDIRKWLPPDTNKVFKSNFERDGILYGCMKSDDTVYEIDLGMMDDDQPIEFCAAHGIFEFEGGRTTCHFQEIELSGRLTEACELSYEGVVDGNTPDPKIITSSETAFPSEGHVGSVRVGSQNLGGTITESDMGRWEKRFDIYPTEGGDYQTILSCFGDGHAAQWDSYTLRGVVFSESNLSLS